MLMNKSEQGAVMIGSRFQDERRPYHNARNEDRPGNGHQRQRPESCGKAKGDPDHDLTDPHPFGVFGEAFLCSSGS
jgi:hypothetical protein